MRDTLPEWSLAPVVQALQAMRGVQLVAAMTLVAELQDFLRFDNPRQLMAYVGLVPGEHSSGPKRRQGSIYPRPATARHGACWSRWRGTTSTARA
jgi:transposase